MKCTAEDIGLVVVTASTEPEVVAARDEMVAWLDEYFGHFSKPTDDSVPAITGRVPCAGCNAKLDGLMGTFTWGLAHGEGHCSKCRHPARGIHRLEDGPNGASVRLDFVLSYLLEEETHGEGAGCHSGHGNERA